MRRLMLGAATAAIAITAGCSALGKAAFQQPIVNLRMDGILSFGVPLRFSSRFCQQSSRRGCSSRALCGRCASRKWSVHCSPPGCNK